jgi:DNA-binding GntR family transcriptional regulator
MSQTEKTQSGNLRKKPGPASRTAGLSKDRRDALNAYLRRHLAEGETRGAKHVRLQAAILAAIAEGVLGAGDQLPPEPELADGVGLSLGTIRRGLTHLANDGVVSREHGRGTFISGLTLTENEVWHMRFLEDDLATVRPIYQRMVSREIVGGPGAWEDFLGPNRHGFVRVRRAVNVDSLFVCHSDFYLPGDRFRGIMDMDPHEIESVGLKHVLRLTFDVPIGRVRKVSQILPTPEDVSAVIGVAPGHPAQCLDVRSYSYENVPTSYQAIWIPPTGVPLDLSGPDSMAAGQKG